MLRNSLLWACTGTGNVSQLKTAERDIKKSREMNYLEQKMSEQFFIQIVDLFFLKYMEVSPTHLAVSQIIVNSQSWITRINWDKRK